MTRQHWIFFNANGCATTVADKAAYPTETDAWADVYGSRKQEKAARARGVTVQLVDHDRYVRQFEACMRGTCSHSGGGR